MSAPNVSGRESLKRVRRCVVKIGSAVLTNSGKGLNRDAVTGWAEQIAHLKQRSIECVVGLGEPPEPEGPLIELVRIGE